MDSDDSSTSNKRRRVDKQPATASTTLQAKAVQSTRGRWSNTPGAPARVMAPSKQAKSVAEYDIKTVLSELSQMEKDDLLTEFAARNADLADRLRRLHDQNKLKQPPKLINFCGLEGDVDNWINVDYAHLSSRKQFDIAGEVGRKICGNVKAVAFSVNSSSYPLEKECALSTLCRIGMIVCVSAGSELAKGVRNDYDVCSELSEAMLHVVGCMTTAERRDVCKESGIDMISRIDELERKSSDFGDIIPDLDKVRENLKSGLVINSR